MMSLAVTPPPGELMTRITALTWISSLANFSNSCILSGVQALLDESSDEVSWVMITPWMGKIIILSELDSSPVTNCSVHFFSKSSEGRNMHPLTINNAIDSNNKYFITYLLDVWPNVIPAPHQVRGKLQRDSCRSLSLRKQGQE